MPAGGSTYNKVVAWVDGVQALSLAQSEKDKELVSVLLEACELLGRFVLPETYIALIAPRIRGDALETPYGIDEVTEGHRPRTQQVCESGRFTSA
jgi:hypothetical protein